MSLKFKIDLKATGPGLDGIFKRLMDLDGMSVDAGLLDPAQALKGAAHEFGTRNIPARPWLSVAADNMVPGLTRVSADAVGDVADGGSPRKAMSKVGEFAAKAAKEVITTRQVGGPPLAPATVEAKGSDVKLIDTGKMVDSITHEVQD